MVGYLLGGWYNFFPQEVALIENNVENILNESLWF